MAAQALRVQQGSKPPEHQIQNLESAGSVECLGRRRPLLVGYGICGSACFMLTLALLFQSTVPELSYLSVICVFACISGHSIRPSEYLRSRPPSLRG